MSVNTRSIILLIGGIFSMIVFIALFIVHIIGGEANKFFLYLTFENLLACSIYLILVAYYEILDKNDSAAYKFLTHRVGKFVFTSCITVVQSYWTYTLMGSDIIPFPQETASILITIYIHFIIGLLMLYEITTNEKRYYLKGLFYRDLRLLISIMIVYTIILMLISKGYGLYVYDFHKKDVINILGYNIVGISNMCTSYLLYYSLSRRLDKTEDPDILV